MTEHRTPYDAGNSTQAPSDLLPCGHPRSAVRCADPDAQVDTTCWCGWCEDVDEARNDARRWAKAWKDAARSYRAAYHDTWYNYHEATRQLERTQVEERRRCHDLALEIAASLRNSGIDTEASLAAEQVAAAILEEST